MTRVIATIDEEGRLNLPEALREQFKGRAGEQISVEIAPDSPDPFPARSKAQARELTQARYGNLLRRIAES